MDVQDDGRWRGGPRRVPKGLEFGAVVVAGRVTGSWRVFRTFATRCGCAATRSVRDEPQHARVDGIGMFTADGVGGGGPQLGLDVRDQRPGPLVRRPGPVDDAAAGDQREHGHRDRAQLRAGERRGRGQRDAEVPHARVDQRGHRVVLRHRDAAGDPAQERGPGPAGDDRQQGQRGTDEQRGREGPERGRRVEQGARGEPCGGADRQVGGQPAAERHPGQVHSIQVQYGQGLRQPRGLVRGGPDGGALGAAAGLAQQVKRVHRVVRGERREVGRPHGRGARAAGQQHQRRARRRPEAVRAHGAEPGRHVVHLGRGRQRPQRRVVGGVVGLPRPR